MIKVSSIKRVKDNNDRILQLLISFLFVGYDQGLALDLADVLLKIDFSLIENRIQELWPILLNVSFFFR